MICHKSMFNNPQQCTIIFKIYEHIQYDVQLCTSLYDKKHHYDTDFVAHKSFTCKTFFLNSGFSCERSRITTKNRDNLRKAETSFEFPIRTFSHPKSRKWDSTLTGIVLCYFHPCKNIETAELPNLMFINIYLNYLFKKTKRK